MDKLEHEAAGSSVATADHPAAKTTKPAVEGLHIPTRFCPDDGADPFDTVEWDLRTAAIKGEGRRGALRAERLRSPHLVEPIGDQRRRQQIFLRRGRHRRARKERPAVDPSRQPHDRRLGHRRTAISPRAADGERFYRDLTWLCLHQHGVVQFAGLVQRRPVSPVRHQGRACATGTGTPKPSEVDAAGKPLRVSARLGLLHPERAGQHGRHHGARPQRGHALQVRLGHGHRSFARSARIARSSPAAASRRGRCRSCGSTTRSRPW